MTLRCHWAAMVLLCLMPACQDDRIELVVTVDVAGVEAQSLRVTVSADARPDDPWQGLVDRRLDRFTLRLPASQRGSAGISIDALNGRGCLTARSRERRVVLDGERSHELAFVLEPLRQAACGVVVERIGGGRGTVSADPPLLSCPDGAPGEPLPPCTGTFPPGRPVRLLAQAEPGTSAFIGWTGACRGTSCAFTPGNGPTLLQAGFLSRNVCTSGYCWEEPRPQGESLVSVWSSGRSVWAVGDSGTVLRRVGDSWAAVPSGTEEVLTDVTGVTDSAGDERIHIVGNNGTVLTGRGATLERIDSGTTKHLRRIIGSGSDDLWIVGYEGTVLRWQGERITPIPSGTTANLIALWSAGPDDIWMGGTGGALLRWQGGAFARPLLSGDVGADIYSIWGASSDDVWIVGRTASESIVWRGNAAAGFQVVYRSKQIVISDVWGLASDDVWLVGTDVLRYDGERLRPLGLEPGPRLRVRGSAPWDIWIVGNEGYSTRWNGAAWDSTVKTPAIVVGMGQGSDGRPYAITLDGARLERSATGIWARRPAGEFHALSAAILRSEEDAWAVDASGALLGTFEGSWQRIDIGVTTPLRSIARGPQTEVALAGDGGLLLRCETDIDKVRMLGRFCTTLDSATRFRLNAVSYAGAQELWAVGEGGTVVRCRGGQCGLVPSGTRASLHSVLGTASGEVWVGGEASTLLRLRGADLVPAAQLPANRAVELLLSAGSDGIWAVGDKLLARYDGQTFSVTSSVPLLGVRAGLATAAGTWIAGAGVIRLTE